MNDMFLKDKKSYGPFDYLNTNKKTYDPIDLNDIIQKNHEENQRKNSQFFNYETTTKPITITPDPIARITQDLIKKTTNNFYQKEEDENRYKPFEYKPPTITPEPIIPKIKNLFEKEDKKSYGPFDYLNTNKKTYDPIDLNDIIQKNHEENQRKNSQFFNYETTTKPITITPDPIARITQDLIKKTTNNFYQKEEDENRYKLATEKIADNLFNIYQKKEEDENRYKNLIKTPTISVNLPDESKNYWNSQKDVFDSLSNLNYSNPSKYTISSYVQDSVESAIQGRVSNRVSSFTSDIIGSSSSETVKGSLVSSFLAGGAYSAVSFIVEPEDRFAFDMGPGLIIALGFTGPVGAFVWAGFAIIRHILRRK